MSRLALLTAVLVLFGGPVGGGRPGMRRPPAALAPAAAVAYRAPVPGAVVRPFAPPPTPYAAGHRGVDLAAGPSAVVGAAAAGTVRFAGAVAGRGVVVLAHADGI